MKTACSSSQPEIWRSSSRLDHFSGFACVPITSGKAEVKLPRFKTLTFAQNAEVMGPGPILLALLRELASLSMPHKIELLHLPKILGREPANILLPYFPLASTLGCARARLLESQTKYRDQVPGIHAVGDSRQGFIRCGSFERLASIGMQAA